MTIESKEPKVRKQQQGLLRGLRALDRQEERRPLHEVKQEKFPHNFSNLQQLLVSPGNRRGG